MLIRSEASDDSSHKNDCFRGTTSDVHLTRVFGNCENGVNLGQGKLQVASQLENWIDVERKAQKGTQRTLFQP